MIAWTLLLLIDGEEVHGYKLHEGLLARGIDVQPSAVYRLLHTIEEDRWVTSRWGDAVSGPRRREYSLQQPGRDKLHEISRLIAATRDAHDTFLHGHRHALAQRAHAPSALDETTEPQAHDRAPSRGRPRARTPSTAPLRPRKELLVGWLLLRMDAGPTYGWELRRHFVTHGLRVDAPEMYRMLRKLERDEWLQSRWLGSSAGPRRRFYRLTTRGRRNLDEIAVLIAAVRGLHDAYLREYEQAHGRHPATTAAANRA